MADVFLQMAGEGGYWSQYATKFFMESHKGGAKVMAKWVAEFVRGAMRVGVIHERPGMMLIAAVDREQDRIFGEMKPLLDNMFGASPAPAAPPPAPAPAPAAPPQPVEVEPSAPPPAPPAPKPPVARPRQPKPMPAPVAAPVARSRGGRPAKAPKAT
jgi:hypothetical protein